MRRLILSVLFMVIYSASFSSTISTNLSATFDRDKKSVKLKWQNNDPRIQKFILQRSRDNSDWENIYAVSTESFSLLKIEKYTDLSPASEKNYYRLKTVLESGEADSSTAIMILIGGPAGSWSIFPVPVISVLNLQYFGSELITGVITVVIQNQQGKILMQTRNSSLMRVIQMPVANLRPGLYIVRIMIEGKPVWIQQFSK